MERIPGPGEFYRHFKNKLYQIIAVAVHSETGEKMVVYQALYGDFGIYVRPLSMFAERVDREKYPEAAQEYRFERVEPGKQTETEETDEPVPDTDNPLHPLFMEFLEEEEFEKRMNLLSSMKGNVGQRELDSLYLCLDAKPCSGTTEEQLDSLRQYLTMQQRYDVMRLRRR